MNGRAALAVESDAPPDAGTRRALLAAALDLPESALDSIPAAAGERVLDHLLDLTARVRRLEAEAARDDLTGALRRGVGTRLLQGEIDRVRRGNGRLVVAFIDCDDLKQVNDTEGHAAGDRLLQLVASTLRRRLRSYDLVIRYGGDEFVCVLSGAASDGARAKLALVSAELSTLLGRPIISAGLAELDGEDAEESAAGLVARADADLYAARTTRRLAR